MQRRLIACVALGAAGLCVASRLEGVLNISATFAYLAAGGSGIAVGYVGSMLFDVFAGSGNAAPPES